MQKLESSHNIYDKFKYTVETIQSRDIENIQNSDIVIVCSDDFKVSRNITTCQDDFKLSISISALI